MPIKNSLTRRSFCATAAGATALAQGTPAAENPVQELSFSSTRTYSDPGNDVVLDVVFAGPGGVEHRVPAFWAGRQTWRVRYAPPVPGQYHYQTIANDTADSSLHGQTGSLNAAAFGSPNPLYRHGAIRVARDRRHFEHADGEPFFWLADTWWMGLCQRMRWPEDFQALAADRTAKGFSVVQIIAGLYPDMPPFDERGRNEAGYPWENNYARINPAYFDRADLRIQHLVSRGLVPCIVGCWGYFLPLMGKARIQQHWRNLIARWGAYPVVWCLAGEGTMPYYLSTTPKEDAVAQKQGWTEVARYVRATDPYRRMITIHPSSTARDSVEDASVLDFDMLQTGHGDRTSLPNTVNRVVESLQREPKMPVLVGEVCYEGIMEAGRQEVQRLMFWTAVLSGAAGHTYGANGIWQVNTTDRPFGPSPHGRNWGTTPWDVAAQLPGSKMLGVAKAILARYPWWRFEPHPEWVEPHWDKENYSRPYAAGIPREIRVIFIPPTWNPPKVARLEADMTYQATYFDLTTGARHAAGQVTADASGQWQAPIQPTVADWVLVLDRRGPA
ncbi:MAG TPA: DUF4038 domain-containing protein [Candidatus Acidoferrales bacterium]|jgi:hypothetical protein|nr:DUF4038 domain-containing protein [Candidatus Acidoferrales bacterium]